MEAFLDRDRDDEGEHWCHWRKKNIEFIFMPSAELIQEMS